MPHSTLTTAETARYLHLQPEDLERLMRQGDIPFSMAGARAVFRKIELDAWASRRILGFNGRQLQDYHGQSQRGTLAVSGNRPLVSALLTRERVASELLAKTRASVLREMVKLADRTGLLIYPDDLLASLEEREALCSTALPGGVALLHPRHHDEHLFEASFLVLARTPQPIPFNAPDGKRTDLFFLLCCGDDRQHLHLLSRLCMLCMKTALIERLRLASDGDAMADAVTAAETDVVNQMGR